jgi:hypothetical protein
LSTSSPSGAVRLSQMVFSHTLPFCCTSDCETMQTGQCGLPMIEKRQPIQHFEWNATVRKMMAMRKSASSPHCAVLSDEEHQVDNTRLQKNHSSLSGRVVELRWSLQMD